MRRIATVLGLLVFSLVSGGGSAIATESTGDTSGSEQTPLERVNAYVQPSIVYLQQDWTGYIYDKTNKQYLSTEPFTTSFQCTGFVVNPNGYIATAGHCVDPREVLGTFVEQGAQWAVDNGYYEDVTLTAADVVAFNAFRIDGADKKSRPDLNVRVGWGASAAGVDTSQVMRARVVDYQRFNEGDVALLKVEATDLNAISLADTSDLEVGTEVVSIGFAASVDSVTDPNLTPSYKEGSISSVKTVEGGLLTVYETSAAVSGGMSGGPTVNLDGEVVGVNSFSPASESQSFNFIRPSGQMNELLAGAGVTNELTETTQTYRDGLDAYFSGDKDAAVAAFETVVDDQPSNKLAAQYLDKAEEMPAPPKPAAKSDESGLPILPIAGGLVALLVIGGVVAFFLIRRKPAAGTPVMNAGPTGAPLVAPAQPMSGMGGPMVAPTGSVATQGSPVVASTPVPAPPVGDVGPPTPPAAPPAGPAAAPAAPTQPLQPVGFASQPPAAPAPAEPTVAPQAEEAAAGAEAGPALLHFCPSCGTKADEGQRFCGNCGTSLVS